jgi:hypothetical protein
MSVARKTNNGESRKNIMRLLYKKLANRWIAPMVALISAAGVSAEAQVNLSSGLKAYWTFDGNLEDSAGDFDGTAVGSAAIPFVDGKPGFGKAIKLDGEDQYVEVTGGEPDDLAFEGGSISIAGWFKVGAFDTSWQALVAKGEGSNWRVARSGDGQGIAYAGGLTDTPAGKSVNDGNWHHFVAISDSAGAAFGTALYVDGVLDTKIDGTAALAANGARVSIGDNPGARGREFEGEMDDIAIWDRVLSQAEIDFLYANGAGKPLKSIFGVQIDVLGTGAEALLGSDLTDPENDGEDALGAATSPTWNWAGITSSHEPDFEGGENSFNIFDNKVGGGNDKWCCDDPTPGSPVWVAVQFANPVSISHFTVTSGNDSPDRDPTDWAIQGSTDGATFSDIYRFTGTTLPWTERNQVVKFTLATASAPYRYVRYIAFATPGTLHQLNEVELFGSFGTGNVGFISGIGNTLDTFRFRLNDSGTSLIDPASVGLVLDGATIPLGTLTKTDGKIDVSYKAPSPFLPGSTHTYSITSKDNFGNNITSTGSFTVIQYALLTATDKVTPVTAKPGFIFNVHQNEGFQANDNTRPVQQLAGALGVNNADPGVLGAALAAGVPGANANLPLRYEIESVINMNQDVVSIGNAPDDTEIPGVPGITGSTDGIAAEILTYIELPAGPTTMIFNSDDGFRTTGGLVLDVFKSQLAGQFVGGRGSADTVFTVYAETAGVYPFRTIWYEGGGGANLEWLTVKADGTKVLVNNTAEGGVKAYREAAGGGPTVISAATPGPGATGVLFDTSLSVSTTDGSDAVDASSMKLSLDGTETSAVATKAGRITTISFKPATPFAGGSVHTASVTFRAGSATRTETWQFTVAPFTLDRVASRPGLLNGAAKYTADRGGRSGNAGDYAMDFPAATGSINVPDASFVNTAAGTDKLSVSFWQKNEVRAGSSFWFNSPSSNEGTRGFQAHVPWSDGTIYFDSAGCCGADTQRISLNITEFPAYTGSNTWWNSWHHFAFVKNGGVKEIYIDGQLFHSGSGDPLPTDFTNLIIGGGSGVNDNRIAGTMDDFAVFSSGLTAAQVTALFNGTAPGAITGNPGLLAHWDFNDVPAPVVDVKVMVSRSGGNVTITSEPAALPAGWVLQTAPSISGPWTTQAGATTPVTVPIAAGNSFLRAAKP